MLTISKDSLSIQHIMWQPIFKCIMGCRGCYVAESPSSKYRGRFVSEIVDLVFQSETVNCEQFTISLDSLSEPHDDLVLTLKWLWWFYSQGKDCGCATVTRKSLNQKDLPELCVTVKNIQTLQQWARWVGMSMVEFLKPLTLVSLSKFPASAGGAQGFQRTTQHTKTVLNYNHLAKDNHKQASTDNGYKYSDQVYMVFMKKPLGEEQNPAGYDTLLDNTAAAVAQRGSFSDVHVDQCIKDAGKYNKTGLTCGASIHKVHVWPDGSVTGCPYDSMHRGHDGVCPRPPAMRHCTWTELKSAVINRQCHPMELCKIPQMLKELEERDKNKVALTTEQS